MQHDVAIQPVQKKRHIIKLLSTSAVQKAGVCECYVHNVYATSITHTIQHGRFIIRTMNKTNSALITSDIQLIYTNYYSALSLLTEQSF